MFWDAAYSMRNDDPFGWVTSAVPVGARDASPIAQRLGRCLRGLVVQLGSACCELGCSGSGTGGHRLDQLADMAQTEISVMSKRRTTTHSAETKQLPSRRTRPLITCIMR